MHGTFAPGAFSWRRMTRKLALQPTNISVKPATRKEP
jgi:hypothetical protein